MESEKDTGTPTVKYVRLKEYKNFPHSPGIYKFYDGKGDLLYIGKARDLKKRVSSYFQARKTYNYKTQKMVEEIASFSFLCVDSEQDALFLERNLIQKHQPRYNIMFRDDKSYPYLCVTKERYPRLLVLRKVQEKKGYYYGPHTNVYWLRCMLRDLRKTHKIRTCRLVLSEAAVRQKKYKVCLEYHLGNCLGPCEGLQKEEDYVQNIAEVTHIIKGNLSAVRADYKEKITRYAASLDFEKAQEYKNKINGLEKFNSKSIVDAPKKGTLDIFAWTEDKYCTSYIHYLRVEHGTLTVGENIEVNNVLEERKEDIAPLVMIHLMKKHHVEAREIVSNIRVDTWSKHIKVGIPIRGSKKKLLELAIKNAMLFKERSQSERQHDTRSLKEALQLPKDPKHIECFDVSNIKGSIMVAAVVCFKEGKPVRKEYRRMKIRTVQQQDDYACMREAVYRRYNRLLKEKKALPNLVVIDGGKGHLQAALSSLKQLKLASKVPVISIAKKLEEIYTHKKNTPIRLPKDHPALHLIQNIRDEAHRFAVRYLRKESTKQVLGSALMDIEGIGPESTKKLLRILSTKEEISRTSTRDLAKIVGPKKAGIIKGALRKH